MPDPTARVARSLQIALHVMLCKPLIPVAILAAFLTSSRAQGAERLCDATFENCRTPLLDLIHNEQIGIDVAFWFMEDARYSTALIERWRAGVPVRVIMDSEANANYPGNVQTLNALRNAGIPLLEKTSSGIVHWKMMLFAGQNVVEFSGANFSPHAFVPREPYVDYIDEVIYFCDDPAIVNSFKRRYDDIWVTTSGFTPYANLSGTRSRTYASFPVNSQMNFPPYDNFATRSVGRYHAETESIDSIMFRVTDRRHSDALIAAMRRGVPLRLITDVDEYRDPRFLWNAFNIDLLYAAGAQVRFEGHVGPLHQKSTVLHGQQMVIFGSSNWTTGSASRQLEHNIFTTKALFYQFFTQQFERKWNNQTGHQETMGFVPGPPDRPTYVQPANAAQNQPFNVTLRWAAGPWAHVYDIYLGTTAAPPLLAGNVHLGPSATTGDDVTYAVSGLQPGTTYYWRVVSKTMANVTRNGPVWNFRTSGGSTPGAGLDDIVLHAGRATVRQGRWQVTSDSTAAGGSRIGTTDAGEKRTASASPADYFEMTFNAAANVPYRLWFRGKAQGNGWANDSAFVQFSNAVTSGGAATYRIGTPSATTVTIEDCSGCGLSGWGWNDNAYGTGALGPLIYFATTGEQRIRVQLREDGLSIDQIVLSRGPFLNDAPGATRNDGTIYSPRDGTTSVSSSPTALPAGWQSRDSGPVGFAGPASATDGTFAVRGAAPTSGGRATPSTAPIGR